MVLVTLGPVPATFAARSAVLAALTAVLAAGFAAGAQAQDGAAGTDPGRLALMPSASDSSAPASELATELDPLLLAQLKAVVRVTPAARPALDLPAMQLALDCVGQTPECLRAVSAQTATDSLLAPSVQAASGELVVTLLHYDARSGALRSVVKRHAGEGAHRAALDAVPAMLRELFDIAEGEAGEPEPEPEPEPVDDGTIEPAFEPPVEKPFPVGPVIVGGVGAALVGAGVGFGLAANASEKDWKTRDPMSEGEVSDALEIEDRAQTQATLSNVGFIVGAAALTAGAVWLALELSSEEPAPQVAVLPVLAPGAVGLHVRGSL